MCFSRVWARAVVETTDVVVADGLTRRFGDFTAVDDASFRIPAGQIFGFLGPNGAGKTTTIRMLTGLLEPTAGRATVAGYDVARDSTQVKRRIGYMSQRFSLYADLRVEENIAFFAGLYGVSGEQLARRRDWILDMADLRPHRRRVTGELPLGWRQRLALGCALLHEPPVLFLDEPTSGVDPRARRNFWDLIRTMADGGTTVLVSTHYMEEAEYADRLALMNRGRIIALDTPVALRAALEEPLLEVRTADPVPILEALRGAVEVIDATLHGRAVRVLVHNHERGAQTIRQTLEARGLDSTHVERVEPSLEDVFTQLVRREGGAVAG
jgi:ABC-2 type transport system ATP-binding protein